MSAHATFNAMVPLCDAAQHLMKTADLNPVMSWELQYVAVTECSVLHTRTVLYKLSTLGPTLITDVLTTT